MNLGRNLPIRSAEDVGLITEVSDLQLAAERLDVGSEGVDLAGHLDVCGVLPLPQLGEAMLTGGQDHRLRPFLDLVLFGIGEGLVTTWLFYAENLVNFQVTSNAMEALSADDRGSFLALDARWSCPMPARSGDGRFEEAEGWLRQTRSQAAT